MVIDLLHHSDMHRSAGLDGVHPRVLKDLTEELTKLLSLIYWHSWLTGEVPVAWRSANVTPIYKKAWKEEVAGNCSPVSLTWVPVKVTVQIILSAIKRKLQNRPSGPACVGLGKTGPA